MREQTTDDFLTQFDCSRLPEPAELFNFLEQHELGCFIKKDAIITRFRLTDSETKITTHIFCLPVSINLSDEFIRKLSALIKATHDNSIIYLPWQLPNSDTYVPVRFNLMVGHVAPFKFQVDHLNKGYVRHAVPADGECGYTAFGITRKLAYQLLRNHVHEIDHLLQPLVDEALLNEDFYHYLIINKVIPSTVSFTNIKQYRRCLAVMNALIDYEVVDRRVDLRWAHPLILQALAHIQKIELHIWVIGKDLRLEPHCRADYYDYSCYKPEGSNQRLDLLNINRNHFERLEFVGFETDNLLNIGTDEGIYPLNLQNDPYATVDVSAEIVSSDRSHASVLPTQQLVNGLRYYLREFVISNTEPVVDWNEGEPLYWTALHLLMRLSQDSAKCHAVFNKWQQENQAKSLIVLDSLLSTVSLASTSLFYTEQYAAIFKMILQNKANRQLFSHVMRGLQLAALSEFIYNKDRESLSNIFMIVGLHYFTSLLVRKMPEGIFKPILSYCFRFVSILLRFLFIIYAWIPTEEAQDKIDAPRHVYEGMNQMAREAILLPIRLLGITFFSRLMNFFLDKKTMENRDNQEGLFAMINLTMQLLLSAIGPSLFQFTTWIVPQKSEETILSFVKNLFGTLYEIEITNWLFTRVFAQLFSQQQQLSLEFKSYNTSTECELRISSELATNCSDFQLDCRSRFIGCNAKNNGLEVTTPLVIVPTVKGRFCQE